MILYPEAIQKIETIAKLKVSAFLEKTEVLSLDPNQVTLAIGRILSEELIGQEAIPSFDNSSMDGFALRSEWTTHASEAHPARFSVSGTAFAGDVPLVLSDANCIEIMTGAPLPTGADAVVKIEDVRVNRDVSGKSISIEVLSPLKPLQFVRKRGTDFHPGQRIARMGARVSAEQILALTTVGIAKVKVLRKPKIAVVSTGNELTEKISDPLAPGMIHNSTAPYLMSALPFFGAEGKYYGLVRDDAESFKVLLKKILEDAPDVILTTGAVSKGKLDFVPGALKEMGAKLQFHGVAIRPGKPLLFAEFENGPAVFAVPGNPISTAVALRFFISPYLNALQGLSPEVAEPAKLTQATDKALGLRCFWKASVVQDLRGTSVSPMNGQESYRVSSLLPANAWMILSEAGEEISAGASVQTVPLYPKTVYENEPHDEGCC
jgi:molybdopterin molybdotransferase